MYAPDSTRNKINTTFINLFPSQYTSFNPSTFNIPQPSITFSLSFLLYLSLCPPFFLPLLLYSILPILFSPSQVPTYFARILFYSVCVFLSGLTMILNSAATAISVNILTCKTKKLRGEKNFLCYPFSNCLYFFEVSVYYIRDSSAHKAVNVKMTDYPGMVSKA